MDYQLKPLGKTCSQTGKPLGPGEICYSAVVEKGTEWVRLDFSAGAWTGPPEGALGFWRVTVPARDQPRRRSLDPDALLRQFEQLSEDANPGGEKFRYVLALLLVQRRRLRITHRRAAIPAGACWNSAGCRARGRSKCAISNFRTPRSPLCSRNLRPASRRSPNNRNARPPSRGIAGAEETTRWIANPSNKFLQH